MLCCTISINERILNLFKKGSIKQRIRCNKIVARHHHNQQSKITRRQIISTVAYLSPFLFTLNKQSSANTTTEEIAIASIKSKKKNTLEEFKSHNNDFKFIYPAEWIVAFDRTESHSSGTLVLIGDFINIDTLSIKSVDSIFTDSEIPSIKHSEIDVNDEDLKTLMETLLLSEETAPSSINFENYNFEINDDDDIQRCTAIYKKELCRGVIEEGLRGTKLCNDKNGMPLKTISRVHIVSLLRKDNKQLCIDVSTPLDRWLNVPKQQDTLKSITNSFELI